MTDEQKEQAKSSVGEMVYDYGTVVAFDKDAMTARITIECDTEETFRVFLIAMASRRCGL